MKPAPFRGRLDEVGMRFGGVWDEAGGGSMRSEWRRVGMRLEAVRMGLG